MIVRPPDEEGFHRRPLSNCCGVGVVYFRRDIGRFVGCSLSYRGCLSPHFGQVRRHGWSLSARSGKSRQPTTFDCSSILATESDNPKRRAA